MKLVFSPLVGGMSGAAADAVAAKWKGIPYVRQRVVPHNPKSAGQVTQRGYVARMAKQFRSLPAALVVFLNAIGVGQALSGFNVMAKACLNALHDALAMTLMPGTPQLVNVQSITAVAGTLSSTILVEAVPGAAVLTHYLALFTCPADPDEVGKVEPDVWTAHTPQLVSAYGAGTAPDISVATADKEYHVAALVIDAATLALATKISGGVAALGTSKA